MSNLILLSENKDFQYLGIPFPKDGKFDSGKYGSKYVIFIYKASGLLGAMVGCFNEEPEILGVIGNGSEISEEVIKEAINFDSFYDQDESTIDLLKHLLYLKGIQIENPIPKPDDCIMKIAPYYDIEEYDKWLDSENKTVKLVIIKVKK